VTLAGLEAAIPKSPFQNEVLIGWNVLLPDQNAKRATEA
jgi:hypothetical protein